MSLATLFFSPVSKALIARFGGVAAVGYFELAYRMVFYLRSFIVSAHRALLPMIADLHERAPEQMAQLYQKSFRYLSVGVAVGIPSVLWASPGISVIWLGDHNPTFVLYAWILGCGWFLNLLSGPAYFANLGSGHLRWNTWAAVLMSVLNGALGLALGVTLGSTGVVLGFAVAVVVGALLVASVYQREYRILWTQVIEWETVRILVGGLLAGLLLLLSTSRATWQTSAWPLLAVGATVQLGIAAGGLLYHPLRAEATLLFRSLTLRQTGPRPRDDG